MSSYDAVKVELAMDSLREALDSESTYSALMLAFNQFKSKAYEIGLMEQSYGISDQIHVRMHEHRASLNVLICAYMNLAKMYYEKFYWENYRKKQPTEVSSMVSNILKNDSKNIDVKEFQSKIKEENPELELGLKLRNFMQHNVLLSDTISTSFNNDSENIFFNTNTSIPHERVLGKSNIDAKLLDNFANPIDVNILIDKITECISTLHLQVRTLTENKVNQEHVYLINLNHAISTEVNLINKKYEKGMSKATLITEDSQQEIQYYIGWFSPYKHSKEKYRFFLPHSRIEYSKTKQI